METYTNAAAAEKKAKEELDAARVPEAQPAHPLEAYTGEYEHPGYGHLSVRLADGTLQMVMNDKKTFTLALAHDDLFDAHELSWEDRLKVAFVADARGRIASLSIPLEESVRNIVFVRLPRRKTRT